MCSVKSSEVSCVMSQEKLLEMRTQERKRANLKLITYQSSKSSLDRRWPLLVIPCNLPLARHTVRNVLLRKSESSKINIEALDS